MSAALAEKPIEDDEHDDCRNATASELPGTQAGENPAQRSIHRLPSHALPICRGRHGLSVSLAAVRSNEARHVPAASCHELSLDA